MILRLYNLKSMRSIVFPFRRYYTVLYYNKSDFLLIVNNKRYVYSDDIYNSRYHLPYHIAVHVYAVLRLLGHPVPPPPKPFGRRARAAREPAGWRELYRRLAASIPPAYRAVWTPKRVAELAKYIAERIHDIELFDPNVIDWALTPAEVYAELEKLFNKTEDELIKKINEQWLKLQYQMRVYAS